MLDRFAEYVAKKLVEAKVRRELKIDAARGEVQGDDKPDEQETATIMVNEIKIINGSSEDSSVGSSEDSSKDTEVLDETSAAVDQQKNDFQSAGGDSLYSSSKEAKDLTGEAQND